MSWPCPLPVSGTGEGVGFRELRHQAGQEVTMYPIAWLPWGKWWFRSCRGGRLEAAGVTSVPELPANDPDVIAMGYVPYCHDGEDY